MKWLNKAAKPALNKTTNELVKKITESVVDKASKKVASAVIEKYVLLLQLHDDLIPYLLTLFPYSALMTMLTFNSRTLTGVEEEVTNGLNNILTVFKAKDMTQLYALSEMHVLYPVVTRH